MSEHSHINDLIATMLDNGYQAGEIKEVLLRFTQNDLAAMVALDRALNVTTVTAQEPCYKRNTVLGFEGTGGRL